MADIERMKAALVAADKAGNVAAARKLAAAIRQVQSATASAPAPAAEPETTAQGLMGAAVRGGGPVAAGAAAGALLGAPLAGVGAIPGAAAGAGAAGLIQMVGDPVTQAVNSLLGTNYGMPSEAMSDLFTRLGVPEPQTAAERVVQTMASGVGGAGASVGLGKTLAGAAGPLLAASGESLAAQPVMQLAGGAGAGAAGQLAAEQGAGPAGQLAASLAGGVAGAGLAGLKTQQQTPVPSLLQPNTKAQAVIDAEAAGITPMTSDVIPPKTFASRWTQTIGERIPIAGTGGVRAEQQAQRMDAVRSVIRDFGADTGTSDELLAKVMKDLSDKRGQQLSLLTKAKNDVIERVGSVGATPVGRATAEIDKQIASLESLKSDAVAPAIKLFADFKNAIQGQPLQNIERLRKQLGDSLSDDPALVAAKTEGEKAARSIYRQLNEDMGDHIKTFGQPKDYNKWKVANKNLSDMSSELKMDALKRVLAKGDMTPKAVGSLLFSSEPAAVRALYNGLSRDGKANARAAIIRKASESSDLTIDNINPGKFASDVGKLSRSVGVFFTGDDLRQVEGLTRALKLTQRAQRAADNPNTGAQAVIPIVTAYLGDLFGSGAAGVASAASIGLAARAYESAPVRNLLVKIAQTPKGSAEEAALVKRAIATMQAQTQIKEPE